MVMMMIKMHYISCVNASWPACKMRLEGASTFAPIIGKLRLGQNASLPKRLIILLTSQCQNLCNAMQ